MMAKVLHSSFKVFCKVSNPCLKFRSYFSERYYAAYSNCPSRIQDRRQHAGLGHNLLSPTKWSQSLKGCTSNCVKILASTSSVDAKQYNTIAPYRFSCKLSHTQLRYTLVSFPMYPVVNSRSFSSYFSGKGDKPEDAAVSTSAGVSEVRDGDGNGGVVTTDWMEKIKDTWNSVADAANYTTQKIQEAADELTPHAQQLLDSHPYLKNVIVPVTCTLSGTILAWVVMPRILRRFHKYAMQGPAFLRSGALIGDEVPYDRSFWGALEDPVRYLVTFIAFSQIAMMVAPSTLASQYIVPAWRGAVILSFVWFLFRWKTNVFSRTLATKSMGALERERLVALDRFSSIGLFAIGLMALAEACGVAVQSILTVGGIGGVATAFAARDVLGNVLSGLSMQFTKPFSLGDTIKAGSIEGQVMEMGLTTTSLLNAEKFPVIVPNSLFSSQVIVNKSRAEWRAMVSKIPLHSDDVDLIPPISNDIKSMLKSHPKVFLGKEVPYCFLSRVESSFAELTIGCNLNHMSKDELYTTQQDILLQSVKIIKGHGAKLGSTMQDMNRQ